MTIRPLPLEAFIAEYENQAKALYDVLISGDEEAVAFVRQHHPVLRQLQETAFMSAAITLDHAKVALARGYHFEDWESLEEWVKEVTDKNTDICKFEHAVDDLVFGNIDSLRTRLEKYPHLVQLRSTRVHHSMLIHYVGANGVEDYRQRSPENIVAILKLLLDSGSELDPLADMYGGSTPFGLAATSIWPARANVLIPLLKAFLDAGVKIDKSGAAGNQQGVIIGCLHNGRPQAASFLAQQGAKLDLEGAAGVGNLEMVKSFFDADGQLTSGATRKQMEYGYVWACEYGHRDVVEFLLDKGISTGIQVESLSGLHWAIVGGHLSVVKLFINRGVDLEDQNQYGGTALGCALWAIVNSDPTYSWPQKENEAIPIIEEILKAGGKVQPGTISWLREQTVLADEQIESVEALLLKWS